jgi:uncharacterized protein YabN with tetrapyrrole methylase and pyrophosphatase domain
MNILKKLTRLEHEAANFGFKWEASHQIMEQIKSEITEIDVHLKDGDRSKLQDEIGDLLHAVFSLCVFNQFDPEKTLSNSIKKFEQRFRLVEQLAKEKGLNSLNGLSFQELMAYWEQAKQRIKKKA